MLYIHTIPGAAEKYWDLIGNNLICRATSLIFLNCTVDCEERKKSIIIKNTTFITCYILGKYPLVDTLRTSLHLVQWKITLLSYMYIQLRYMHIVHFYLVLSVLICLQEHHSI